jgi:hypothetical protein
LLQLREFFDLKQSFEEATSASKSSTKTKDQVESGFLLDIVITEGAAILKLLSSKDETLLIRRDSFLVLDLGLDIINGIGGLDVQGNSLTGKSFYENL